MFFRKKDDRKEIAEIKDVMENEEMPTAPQMRIEPQRFDMPQPRIEPQRFEQREHEAPLFVKVEKYRDLLSTMQEMKLFVAGVKQLFAILNELETVRGDAMGVMRATTQRLEKSVLELDSELTRPRGVSMEMTPAQSQIDGTLDGLQAQLVELRKELQGLK